jgi:hypothetical protein
MDASDAGRRLSALGAAKGGRARAAKLSAAERSRIARAGAEAVAVDLAAEAGVVVIGLEEVLADRAEEQVAVGRIGRTTRGAREPCEVRHGAPIVAPGGVTRLAGATAMG